MRAFIFLTSWRRAAFSSRWGRSTRRGCRRSGTNGRLTTRRCFRHGGGSSGLSSLRPCRFFSGCLTLSRSRRWTLCRRSCRGSSRRTGRRTKCRRALPTKFLFEISGRLFVRRRRSGVEAGVASGRLFWQRILGPACAKKVCRRTTFCAANLMLRGERCGKVGCPLGRYWV